MNLEIVWDGGSVKKKDFMKLVFEWLSFVLSALGILYVFYLLYSEIFTIQSKKNRERIFLLLFIALSLISIIDRRIEFLFR